MRSGSSSRICSPPTRGRGGSGCPQSTTSARSSMRSSMWPAQGASGGRCRIATSHWNMARDDIREAVVERLATGVRARERRDVEPSAGIVDGRSVGGVRTVTGESRATTRAGTSRVASASGSSTPSAVFVTATSVSANTGGVAVTDHTGRARSGSGARGAMPASSAAPSTTAAATRPHRRGRAQRTLEVEGGQVSVSGRSLDDHLLACARDAQFRRSQPKTRASISD